MQLTLTEEEAADLKEALSEAASATSAAEIDYGFMMNDESRSALKQQRARWLKLKEKLP